MGAIVGSSVPGVVVGFTSGTTRLVSRHAVVASMARSIKIMLIFRVEELIIPVLLLPYRVGKYSKLPDAGKIGHLELNVYKESQGTQPGSILLSR
jgi:hypothetical protein